MQWIRTHLKIVIPVALAAVVGISYLAFGVFAIQTLFIDDKVDEAGPVFDSGAGAETVTVIGDSERNNNVDEAVVASDAPPDEPSEVQSSEPALDAVEDPAPTDAPVTTEASEPEIVTLAEGSFISRAHGGEGIATVLTDGSEQRFLRFEQFATDNGPDLNVYLTTADADAPEGEFDRSGEFIDLGDLKGNIGDQNYEIPPDVDVERFDTVVVWCVRFSVAFTSADLN
jgi:hypothetical protein